MGGRPDVTGLPLLYENYIGWTSKPLQTLQTSGVCKGIAKMNSPSAIPSDWQNDVTSPESPTQRIYTAANANNLVSYTITLGGKKRWTLIFLSAVWFYDSNQISLLVHSEQVHKPNRAVFSSFQTTGPRKWENKWTQNLRAFLPCWTNGKIKLVHFHSEMLMIPLNWLLWRKITANNLNFLLVSSPRYLTF